MKFLSTRRFNFAEGYMPEKKTIARLKKHGTRDGVRGIDKQHCPTATEREIAAQYDTAVQFEAMSAQRTINKGTSNAPDLEPMPSESEVTALQATGTTQLAAIATSNRAKLADQWGEVVETRAALDRFKALAGIDDKAVYPESKISHYGSVFLIGLGEAAANSWFYGSASPDGLGAGLLQAAVVSTVLVGAGAMAGSFAFRSCFSPNRVRRAFGLAGMAIYVAFALFVSLAAASFRDALANDISLEGLMLPIAEILVGPAALSFEAITLLAFALMASGLALYKGLTSDTTVPGHGLLDRRYRAALARYKQTWSNATDAVTNGRESAQAQLDNVQETAKRIVERRERALNEAKSAITEYETTKALLKSGFEYAVKVYRDAVDVIEPVGQWPHTSKLDWPELQISNIGATEDAVAHGREILDDIRACVAAANHTLNEVAVDVQGGLETFRTTLEATRLPGTPADSPKLRIVMDEAASV